MILKDTALVLEGGGMRAMFSAGVFEAFMQHEIDFPYISAISAGACNALSYLSKQPMRTRKIIERHVTDSRYYSFWNWVKTGSLFGWDFIFDEIPNKLIPFDYETYAKYPGELHVGTTDCETGKAIWHCNKRAEVAFKTVIASASLPFAAPIVHFDGKHLLDGGMVSPIPYERALEAGYKKIVVILTQNAGYQKKGGIPKWLLNIWYREYPELCKVLLARPALYNKQLAAVEQLEREGKAVIIRPQNPMEIKRLDIDVPKLLTLHDHGLECGLNAYEKIMELENK